MKQETTKSQRIIVGIVCLIFAALIDYLIFLIIKRCFESGIAFLLSKWFIPLALILVAIFLNRTAYMLLRHANGAPPGKLISPHVAFGLCIIAFVVCVIYLAFMLFSPDVFSNSTKNEYFKVLSGLLVAIPTLIFTIIKQYKNL